MPRTKRDSLGDLQRRLALAWAEENARAEERRKGKGKADGTMFRPVETKRIEREKPTQQRLLEARTKENT
jgi:hypothetical protein